MFSRETQHAIAALKRVGQVIRHASAKPQQGLASFWMPFSNNREFKSHPRMLKGAQGMYYTDVDDRKILDGCAGLWCTNAGHCHPRIVEAIQQSAASLDFAPTFNFAHPLAFEFSERLLQLLPGRDYGQVFFTNCGSTAVDTALKIALAYNRVKGEGTRVRLIGRERGYHGVGFGGISVGGIVANRKTFMGLPFVDHLPHTHSLKHMAFSRGLPDWGAHLADELDKIVALHDPSNIACVIVEPVQGSTGVVVPPVGYLQKLRQLCDKHNILLIFDEVITGFGRLGSAFGTTYFDVEPDMICVAKGLTSATVPCGAVICKSHIYQAFMDASNKAGSAIELFHGYTYSGHPLAMAAGLATMDVYEDEKLFDNAKELSPFWENSWHALKGLPNVIDIRNLGLMGAVELSPVAGYPGRRAMDVMQRMWDKGLLVRVTGDTIAMSPPLIVERQHIEQLIDGLSHAIKENSSSM